MYINTESSKVLIMNTDLYFKLSESDSQNLKSQYTLILSTEIDFIDSKIYMDGIETGKDIIIRLIEENEQILFNFRIKNVRNYMEFPIENFKLKKNKDRIIISGNTKKVLKKLRKQDVSVKTISSPVEALISYAYYRFGLDVMQRNYGGEYYILPSLASGFRFASSGFYSFLRKYKKTILTYSFPEELIFDEFNNAEGIVISSENQIRILLRRGN